jgi:carboxyl-terminal processing protease
MSLDQAISLMRGEPGTKVTLTIRHHTESNTRDLTFTREIINTQTVRNVYMINDHIGYIRITDWAESTTPDLSKALGDLTKQGMTKLILDIRSNTGGLLTSSTSALNLFLEGRKLLVYTQGRTKDKMRMDYFSDGTGRYTKLPFVVLVDGASASASEIFAGALRDHGRAKIMGVKTYGKASVQNIFEMQEPGEDSAEPALKLTVAHYYTPKGNDIHGVGIQPDIELALIKYPIIIDKLFYDDMYRRFSE